ncbi:hypothetical protein PF003_g14135 [Phytophthora fragariae]|nr:hypothetical protein PF003_g14135 [Phytophthora fragariae]
MQPVRLGRRVDQAQAGAAVEAWLLCRHAVGPVITAVEVLPALARGVSTVMTVTQLVSLQP